MAEYEERYKIIFDMDATGGGVNINVQGGGGSAAAPAGISQSSAGGAGGLLGAIASSVANISAGKLGMRSGKIGSTISSATLAERVRNFRKSSGGFGAPSDAMTGRGTREVGYGPGQMNPVDMSRSKFRAWNEKDAAYGDAESRFAGAVRGKGMNKQEVLESARKRWATTDAQSKWRNAATSKNPELLQAAKEIKYEGYDQLPTQSTLSISDQIKVKDMIKKTEYTRK